MLSEKQNGATMAIRRQVFSNENLYREFMMSYKFNSPSQSNKCKLFMKSESKAAYLQRCSDVEVICIVSPVTRCSTTVASNVTTYRQVTVVLSKYDVNLSPHPDPTPTTQHTHTHTHTNIIVSLSWLFSNTNSSH
jgi:hypothetical protein